MGVLDGKTALITGGGRGIGRAIAIAFAAHGARVAVAARTQDEIASVAAQCGNGAIAIQLDVTDRNRCLEVVAQCEAQWGHIDILVNNAGIATSHKFTDIDPSTWRRTFEVDVDGAFFLVQAAIPLMLARKSGRVIAIASIASKIGGAYLAHYGAAKHALLGLMRSLASEYAPSGVTFNCVCPGFVDTAISEAAIVNIMTKTGRSRQEATKALLTPQGRLVDPAEVAAICVFLASDVSHGVNGQAINVDGGQVQS